MAPELDFLIHLKKEVAVGNYGQRLPNYYCEALDGAGYYFDQGTITCQECQKFLSEAEDVWRKKAQIRAEYHSVHLRRLLESEGLQPSVGVSASSIYVYLEKTADIKKAKEVIPYCRKKYIYQDYEVKFVRTGKIKPA